MSPVLPYIAKRTIPHWCLVAARVALVQTHPFPSVCLSLPGLADSIILILVTSTASIPSTSSTTISIPPTPIGLVFVPDGLDLTDGPWLHRRYRRKQLLGSYDW